MTPRSLLAPLAALLLGAAFAAPAQAAGTGPDPRLEAARTEVARTIVANIPGARLRTDEHGRIDPLLNVPGLPELAAGRAQVALDPDFWTAAVATLLQGGAVVLPTPIDVVKPEAFLPTAPIANGPRASALPRRERDLSRVTYEWHGTPKTLRQFMRTTESDIVAFVHEGRIIGDLYENGWSADVRHQPWSVTKSFISAVVGIAVGEGKVRSVAEPIDAYIGELKGTAWDGASIQDILEMESGVFWDEDTPVLAQNTQVQQWVQAALDLVTEGRLGQGRNAFLKALPKETTPGTKWRYNSGATQVLAWLTETVYGKPFNQVIAEKLWQPAGMAGDARILTDRAGDAIASQGLYSRVFDLARFGELFRNGGRTPEGRQVVPEAWVRESTRLTEVSRGRYGYQWWVGPMPGTYQASGFQGQKISVSPEHCLTGVRLSHAFGLDTRPGDRPASEPSSYAFGTEFHAAEWNAMYRAVAEHLGACDRGRPAAGGAATSRLLLGRRDRMSRRAALRRGALRVRVGVVGAERVVRVTALTRGRKPVRVATRRLSVRPGTPRWVSVPLTAAGRRALRERRSVGLRVVVRPVSRPGSQHAAQAVVLR